MISARLTLVSDCEIVYTYKQVHTKIQKSFQSKLSHFVIIKEQKRVRQFFQPLVAIEFCLTFYIIKITRAYQLDEIENHNQS